VLGSGGVNPKMTNLMEHLINNPDIRGPGGANLILEMIESLIEEKCGPHLDSYHRENPEVAFPALVRSLKQDGYVIEGLKLKGILPSDLPIAQQKDEMISLLERYQFDTAKGHFEQAVSAHTRGEWASANAQLRSFIESLFDSIATLLNNNQPSNLTSSHARRESLATMSPPFFIEELKEWEVGGKDGFIQGFWRRLHASGSHPGLSDEEDCTFRLHIVIVTASHFLRRLESRLIEYL
jgi:hypothetical protein